MPPLDPPPYAGPSSSNVDIAPNFDAKNDLVIAIDFGTTFTGVAFAHTGVALQAATSLSDMKRIANKVTVVRRWPSQTGHFTDKTPTVIAYNTNPPGWGATV